LREAINEIKKRLAKYPGVVYQSRNSDISVPPRDSAGFAVSLHLQGTNFIVSFDGWHETFTEAEEAVNCFVMGLTDSCRLEVELRRGMARKWTLQQLSDGSWVTHSEVGLLLFPFWRRKRVVYRQNHLSR